MFNYQIQRVDLATGWHLTLTNDGQLIHALNVKLADGRQTYGKLWFLGIPVQRDWKPTELPSSNPDEFWKPAPKLNELIDPLFANNVRILNKLAAEGRVVAVLSNGYVENIAICNGESWSWAANFRKAERQERQAEADELLLAYLKATEQVDA